MLIRSQPATQPIFLPQQPQPQIMVISVPMPQYLPYHQPLLPHTPQALQYTANVQHQPNHLPQLAVHQSNPLPQPPLHNMSIFQPYSYRPAPPAYPARTQGMAPTFGAHANQHFVGQQKHLIHSKPAPAQQVWYNRRKQQKQNTSQKQKQPEQTKVIIDISPAKPDLLTSTSDQINCKVTPLEPTKIPLASTVNSPAKKCVPKLKLPSLSPPSCDTDVQQLMEDFIPGFNRSDPTIAEDRTQEEHFLAMSSLHQPPT